MMIGARLAAVSSNTGAFPNPERVTYKGSGLVFINTYGQVNSPFHSAIIAAENFFQSHFTNSVTLTMSFDLQSFVDENGNPSTKFSASNSYHPVQGVSFATLIDALSMHENSSDDAISAKSLQGFADPTSQQGFSVPVGMARILGIPETATSPTVDDAITLNSNLPWTFGQDAIGTLEHEISEGAMGRIGGLGPAVAGFWGPVDLFRYAQTSNGLKRDFNGFAQGVDGYFSVDGTNRLTEFNNPVVNDPQDHKQGGEPVAEICTGR